MKSYVVYEAGKFYYIPWSDFHLSEWWGSAGNDTNLKLNPKDITSFALQAIMAEGDAFIVDNFGLYEEETVDTGSSSPETGVAGGAAVALLVSATAAGTILFTRKKKR